MSTVVVQDANVFIDLLTAGVLDEIFALEWAFHTTDAVLDEIEESLDAHVQSGRLRVRRLSGDELADVVVLRNRQPRRISIEDCTLLDLAARLPAVLLTGDANLRHCAEQAKLQVRGTLWLLDNLVADGKLAPAQAAVAIERLIAARRRLPGDECLARLRRWGDTEKTE